MADNRRVMAALVAVLVVAATAPTGSIAATPGGNRPAAVDATQECSFPFSSVDATGTEVTVEEEPQRVVTLNPSAAQTMWEIGARDKVVGVTKYATYLEGASEKTNISGGGFTTVVTEKVVGLEPDLVLVPNASNNGNPGQTEKLREAGLTVYVFSQAESLDDIAAKTRLTGELVGACDGAEESATRMEEELATVEEAVEDRERPTVLFVLGPYGYTAGTGTFINTAIETAGATNIAAEEGIEGYKPISEEVVAASDPDWIVKSDGVSLPPSDVYNQSTAVQEGRVLEVDRNFISQPAPQIVKAIVTMAKTFHPEAYAEAQATPTPSPTPMDTPMDTPMPDTAEPDPTPADSPGFGVVVSLVALLGAGLFTRRS